MDFNTVLILFVLLLFLLIIFGGMFVLNPYLRQKNKIEIMKVENEKMNIFMKMDPDLVDDEVSKFIKGYLDEYILNNFIIKKIDYIRKDQIDQMVRDLDKKILIEISELYIFYIKMIINISEEDDLLRYIHKKVKMEVIDFVTEFNKPKDNL